MEDKMKLSVYVTPEVKLLLDELYIKNIRDGTKKSYGEIVSEAVKKYITTN